MSTASAAPGPRPIERIDLGAGTTKLVANEDFSHHWLNDVAGRDVEYRNCKFAGAIVVRGYFFHAKFVGCDFTGSRLIDCNFRQATFEQCRFDYVDFNRCVLPVPQVLANLPSFANVRWELLHNLRANARATGDGHFDAAIVRKEIESEIEHWRAVRRRPSGYYEKYNNLPDQAKAWWNTIRLSVERHVWGHGESLLRLSIATSVALLLLAAVRWICRLAQGSAPTWQAVFREGGESLAFVMQLFVDLPTVSSSDVAAFPLVATTTLIVRYLAIGLAIPVLYKNISKR